MKTLFLIIILFAGQATYAQGCRSSEISSFNAFFRQTKTNGNVDPTKLQNALLCINQTISWTEADNKEFEIQSRHKNINLTLDFKNAVRSRLENRLLTDRNFIRQIAENKNLELQRSQAEALYNYYIAHNNCIAEDLKLSSQPNRLSLNCPKNSRTLLSAEASLNAQKGTRIVPQPRPALPLPSAKTLLACQALSEVQEKRNIISCNAQAYCKSYTRENSAPILKGTHVSSSVAEADHTRFNLTELSGCDGVRFIPLCKSNFYRSPTSSEQSPQFILGNRDESFIERPLAVFTQGTCSPKNETLIIPRIANEYGDGNVFYNTKASSQMTQHCSIDWDLYLRSYKKLLQKEFELSSEQWNCDEIATPRMPARPTRPNRSEGSR